MSFGVGLVSLVSTGITTKIVVDSGIILHEERFVGDFVSFFMFVVIVTIALLNPIILTIRNSKRLG